MLSESWLKDKNPCLVFVKERQRESDDSDRQDVHVEDSPEESEHESEHSCHDPSHMMTTLSPQIFCISQPLK